MNQNKILKNVQRTQRKARKTKQRNNQNQKTQREQIGKKRKNCGVRTLNSKLNINISV